MKIVVRTVREWLAFSQIQVLCIEHRYSQLRGWLLAIFIIRILTANCLQVVGTQGDPYFWSTS